MKSLHLHNVRALWVTVHRIIMSFTDVESISDRHHVEESQEKVNTALLEYCSTAYPDVMDKFGQLLVRLPEIRLIGLKGEEYLYYRHLSKDIPEQTLLMEMLHARRR